VRGGSEVDPPRGAGQLDALDLGQHLHAALHLPGLGRLVAEALDEPLDLLDAPGLVARLRLQQRVARLALDEVVVIVARVDREAGRRQLGDRGDHAVQEVTVVGDDDDGARVAGEEILQPGERLEVQMVRRLVEQQERGRQQQQAGQRRAHPPAPRELGHRTRQLVGTEAMLEVAVARGQRLGRRRGQRRRHVFHVTLERPDVREAGERFRQHRALAAGGGLLREVADGGGARAAHAPHVGIVETGEDAAERRLAGAVGADEPDPLPLRDAPRQIAEEDLPAERLGDRLDGDQRVIPCPGQTRA